MKGLSCNSNLLSDLPLEQAIDALAEEGYVVGENWSNGLFESIETHFYLSNAKHF